ncbi:MAG: T9SS C-terminal target domain-containing protein [Cytophagales bacterium]|nr:MAG: T9SS C-terminal target domain-containing protein [Cytophagales bacterium]
MAMAKDEIMATSPSPNLNFESMITTPFMDLNNGTVRSILTLPPDAAGAVGPNHVMAFSNSHIKIQGKNGESCCIAGAGNTPYPFIPLNQFWSPLSGFQPYYECFDPRIVFLHENQKWVAVTVAGNTNSKSEILLAVSRTSDPTGSWLYYKIDAQANSAGQTKDNAWADYPTIGYNKDWFVISANMFDGPTNTFTKVWVITKSNLINTPFLLNPPRIIRKNLGTTYEASSGTLVPTITYDNSNNMFFVERWLTWCIKVWSLSGNIGSETLNVKGIIANAEDFYRPNAPLSQSQNNKSYAFCYNPQTSETHLSSNDFRIQNAICRNNRIWLAHHVRHASNSSYIGISWYKINPGILASDTPIIESWGKIQDPNKVVQYAYPALAVNNNNDVFMSFTATSPLMHPSCAYAFKKSTDASFRDPHIYHSGNANYTSPQNTYWGTGSRWGDYMSASVDPNGIDFWALTQYSVQDCPSFNPDRWALRWARVNASNVATRQSMNQIASAENRLNYLQSLELFPNPAEDLLIINNLNDKVNYKICVATGGSLVLQGTTMKEINISTLKLGVYFVQIEYNESVIIKKLIKQ